MFNKIANRGGCVNIPEKNIKKRSSMCSQGMFILFVKACT